MRSEFTNNAPMSAFAASGACPVSPVTHAIVPSPAAASPLTAPQLQTMRQDQIARELILTAANGYAPVQETKPSTELGGFRGVPPRRKPV